MTTPGDRELLEMLTRLNATITRFSTDLFTRTLDQDRHIELVLRFLDGADRVLRRMSQSQQNSTDAP